MLLPPAKDRQTDFQDPAIFLFPFRMTFLWELVSAGEGSKERSPPSPWGWDRQALPQFIFYSGFFFLEGFESRGMDG